MAISLLLPRLAVASVWIYQGLWCKLLGHAASHQKIVETTPFLNSSRAREALFVLVCSSVRWRHGSCLGCSRMKRHLYKHFCCCA